MSSYNSSALRFFESGFISLNKNVVLGLNNISISYTVDTEELLTFDFNKAKSVYPTTSSWTCSASGQFLNLNNKNYNPQSGDTNITGGTSGALLLEAIKAKGVVDVVFKIDSANYQKGQALLTSYELSTDAGAAFSYSIELSGQGDLVKATS